MRIRQIKPEFHSDELCASWSADVRLFYIGLWQEADDGGWLEWRVPKLGADLFPYQPRGRRERNIDRWSRVLVEARRLMIHDCGHAFVPNLTEHQRFGGRPVLTVTNTHARDCARLRADDRHGKERVGEGKERGGTGGNDERNDDGSGVDPISAAIALNRQILADPDADEHAKRAARKYLMRLGIAA